MPGVLPLTSLEGHNASTQYNATLGYRSLLAPRTETVAVEVDLREPTLTSPRRVQAHTVLRHWARSLGVWPRGSDSEGLASLDEEGAGRDGSGAGAAAEMQGDEDVDPSGGSR